jgi:hypothetical protein
LIVFKEIKAEDSRLISFSVSQRHSVGTGHNTLANWLFEDWLKGIETRK